LFPIGGTLLWEVGREERSEQQHPEQDLMYGRTRLRQDLLRKRWGHWKSRKLEPAEVALLMVEFDDPNLDQETDFDQEVYDVHHNNLDHAHLVHRLELSHSLA